MKKSIRIFWIFGTIVEVIDWIEYEKVVMLGVFWYVLILENYIQKSLLFFFT